MADRFYDSQGEGDTAEDLAELHLRRYAGAVQRSTSSCRNVVVVGAGISGTGVPRPVPLLRAWHLSVCPAREHHNKPSVARDIGIRVRVATTIDGPPDPDAMARLCELHRSLGVADEDHVVRPVVCRGRARVRDEGIEVTPADLPAELTITADGAFWSRSVPQSPAASSTPTSSSPEPRIPCASPPKHFCGWWRLAPVGRMRAPGSGERDHPLAGRPVSHRLSAAQAPSAL